MSIVMAGVLVSFSGILVIAAVILGILPADNKTMQLAFLAIGWIFVVIGAIIRYKELKMDRQREQAKEQLKK